MIINDILLLIFLTTLTTLTAKKLDFKILSMYYFYANYE